MRYHQPRAIGAPLLLGLLLAGWLATAYADVAPGWGGGGEGYDLSADTTVKHGGKASGAIQSGAQPGVFASLTQGFAADDYRGKRLRMTAFVRSKEIDGWTGLWMRIDGKDKTGLAFDNMSDRQIKGTTDWQSYAVVLDVPQEAEQIYFGVLLAGKGQVWVDDFKLEAVGQDVKTTGMELPSMARQGEAPKLPKSPANLDFEQ